MAINKLYKTQIDCSTYEPQIDSTDTIITVKLIDFNNTAVTGKNVALSTDKGKFFSNTNYSKIIKQELTCSQTSTQYVIKTNGFNLNQKLALHLTNGTQNVIINENITIQEGTSNYYTISGNTIKCNIMNGLNIVKATITSIVADDTLYYGTDGVSNLNLTQTTSISKNTNSNGYIQVLYNATDWGFATITANNNNVKLFITGWRHNTNSMEYFSYFDSETDDNLLTNLEYYVDESINHIILQPTMASTTFDASMVKYLGEFYPQKEGEVLPTLLPNEQTFNATQNSNKTYSIGLDKIYGHEWSLEWDMKTTTTSAIMCVGLASSVNIGTSTFDDYVALGVWSDGKITGAMKMKGFSVDKESSGNWELNTWHHCQIESDEDSMYYFTCDGEYITEWGGGSTKGKYDYAAYLTTWKTGTVNIKNISFTDYTSPYLPKQNIKNIIYRPDVSISLDTHGFITARSEINAHPVANTFRLEWNITHPNMNYIPPENYMN